MRGLPGFYVVGLPGSSVREARERVRSSLVAAGKKYPLQRLVVNLVPGNVPKQSTYFDLPIAVALLAETRQVSSTLLSTTLFIGELSLTGAIEPAQGVFLLVEHARSCGYKTVCIPYANYEEATLIEGIEVIPVRHLTDICQYLAGKKPTTPIPVDSLLQDRIEGITFADVIGQSEAKLALSIAAAGNHNILMQGPPGCGKTMLAKCLPELLPPLTEKEAIEVLRIHSAAGLFSTELLLHMRRPFRQVHHSCSAVALLGGGRNLTPGEVTLAHRGVLFLDELPEFARDALEALREPLEDRTVTIRRAEGGISYPASCMVVAAMNPCKCGYADSGIKPCICTDSSRAYYAKRLSGPLLDRFDIAVRMFSVPESLLENTVIETNPRERIQLARQRQQYRGKKDGVISNGDIPPHLLAQYCSMTPGAKHALSLQCKNHQLSMRGRARLMRVARTIADMEDTPLIQAVHVEAAGQFRQELNQSPEGP